MEDRIEIVEYLSGIKSVMPRSSLVIAGASFFLQYRRTRSLPIDSTATWDSLAKATRYAQNIDTVAYVPYEGQMITVKDNGKIGVYVLVIDESLPTADKRTHCKLEPVASQSFGDERYLRKDVKDTLEKGFTSKDTCDIEGGLNVGKRSVLSGGAVVIADTNYALAESQKDNPENSSIMTIGLTEVPAGGGFGPSSLGEMDNTDESFDLVPDGNYMMQKRAGVFYPVKASAGGGGTKLTLTFVTPSNMTAVHGKDTLIKYNYSSLLSGEETGEGIATYTLNSKQVASETIAQGEVSFNIGKYLVLGDNVLVVQVTDSYGATRKLTFKINAVSISVTSTFDETKAYTGAISFVYTPIGAITKVIHFKIDGKEIGTVETAISNRQQTYSIPAQAHGAHSLEVYVTATIDETDIESEHLFYDVICIASGNNTPVIASSFKVTEIEQYDTLIIPFIVYNPASSTSDITLSANGETVSTQTVDRTKQSWSYRANDFGALTLTITCGNTSKTFNVNVTESPIVVEPEAQDLELYLTSQNRSNSDTDRETWSYNNIAATFAGFNWKNNGWVIDDNGYSCLRVGSGATVTIPLKLFASDFRATGKTIEFEFTVRDVYNFDTPVIACWSGERGLQITSQTALLKSEQSSIDTRFKDEERIRLAFVIEKRADNRLMSIYVNGIKSGTMQYPEADNFMQSVPVDIVIGCADATVDIYNIRSYNNNLNRYQLLDNYIADMNDVEMKRELYLRNKIYDDYGSVSFQKVNTMIDCLVFEGALPQYKGDKKTNKVYLFSSVNPSLNWMADIKNNVQGTSSQYYPRKNYKYEFLDGITYTDTGAKDDAYQVTDDVLPAAVFCIKTDFAESSGTHNTGVANMIDTMLKEMNILTEAQKEDSRVRTTIAGRPCLLFHKETADSEPVFIGKVNLNTDKAAENTFGFKEGDESWEFLNNTSDLTLFKTGDMTGWEDNIEARYPDGHTDISNVRKVFEWVHGCKGNVEKFKAEFNEYFEKEQVVFYALLTLVLGMTDQRAKNMFLTRIRNKRWFFIFYDNDTLLPINNESLIAFLYNVEIHDTIGNKNVWNGANSELWYLVEEAFADEIREMYYDMRQRGILSYEKLIDYLYKRQAEKWSEAIYNEDGYYKYEQPLIEGYLDYSNSHENPETVKTGAYLYALQGSRELYGKWIWKNRFLYLDSKFLAGSILSDTAVFRTYTPAVWTGVQPCADISLTSFNAMYFNVKWGSVTRSQRVGFKETFKMVAPTGMTFNDTETIIYGASLITSLGDLSALYPGSVDVAKMTRLKELIIGSTVEGYQNSNMTVLYVGNNRMLRLLNIANCPSYTQPIDVSGCDNIEEIYAQGTSTTAVLLPEAGIVRTMHLPPTITSLTMLNQINITEQGLILDGVDNLSTIRWENTNGVNVLSIIDRCFALDETKLERIRIIGADWTLSTLDILTKLINLKGLDEIGNNVDKAVITGKCYASVATDAQINKLKAAFPELTITYGQLKPMPVTTFTFSSSQYNTIRNSVFECDYEVEKVNEYTYKVTSEDNVTIDFTFKCENHEDFKGSYLVAGTRSQSYTVTYIPLRRLRVQVYGQSVYVQGATVTIGDKTYISDADGYVTLPRGGGAISGTVSAYGYAGNTFSYSATASDVINTVEIYAAVDIKFVVKYGSALIQGATVKVGSQSAITNQYGECVIALGKGKHEYTVTHPNYFDYSGNVTVGTSAILINITLVLNIASLKPKENGNIQMLLQGGSSSVTLVLSHTNTDFIIDWGDGSTTNGSSTDYYYHTYGDSNLYQVEIKNAEGIKRCSPPTSNLKAFWSIGNSAIQNMTFKVCYYLEYIGGDIFKNDSDRTDLSEVFLECNSLISIDLTFIDIMTRVTKLSNMLHGCSQLTSIDLTPLARLVNVTNASYLLSGCRKLTSIDLTPLAGWVNVTNADHLLSSCSGLTSIDLTPLAGWVNVTNADHLLSSCSGLTSLDLTPLAGWVNVTNASYLLYGCSKLTSLDLTPLAGWVNVTNASYLLYGCSKLTSLDLTPLAGWVNVTNASYLLYGCSKLTSLDLTPLAGWVNVTDASSLLSSCSKLTSIDLTPLARLVNVTNASGLLYGCRGLTSIDLTPLASWLNVTNAINLLCDCRGLTSIDLTPLAGWVNVTNASYLLYNCSALTSIDLTPLAGWTKMNSNNGLVSLCNKLTFISVLADTPFTLSSSTSLTNGNDCPIYVPDEAVETYKAATNWSAYSSRIKPISEKP